MFRVTNPPFSPFSGSHQPHWRVGEEHGVVTVTSLWQPAVPRPVPLAKAPAAGSPKQPPQQHSVVTRPPQGWAPLTLKAPGLSRKKRRGCLATETPRHCPEGQEGSCVQDGEGSEGASPPSLCAHPCLSLSLFLSPKSSLCDPRQWPALKIPPDRQNPSSSHRRELLRLVLPPPTAQPQPHSHLPEENLWVRVTAGMRGQAASTHSLGLPWKLLETPGSF